MRIFKKCTALLMALIISSLCMIGIGADSSKSGSDLALDVVFVIDYSGSMKDSDPEGLAKEASKLFVDMCDAGQARVGYVLFGTKVDNEYNLTKIDSSASREAFRKSLGSIVYPVSNGTDIARGLTRAKDMLVKNASTTETRYPMIVFLGDGVPSSFEAGRTEQQHNDELEQTLKDLAAHDIPVYAIGLDKSGATDFSVLENIADRTDGNDDKAENFWEVDSADELPHILSEILAKQLRTEVGIETLTCNGEVQSVPVQIPTGTYLANITIFAPNWGKENRESIRLTSPEGYKIGWDDEDMVKRDSSSSYETIQLKNPSAGEWTLSFVGKENDKITMQFLNFSDIKIDLRADKTIITNGGSINFEAFCSTLIAGETNATIFDGADGVLTVKNLTTGAESQVDLALVNDLMSTAVQFTQPGTYEISAEITGKDKSFNAMTNTMTVTVNPYPLQSLSSGAETTYTLFSPFLGIRIKNNASIPMSDIISWDPSETLNVTPEPGGWEDKCSFDYDQAAGTVKVTANKSGNSVIKLKISTTGQELDYTINIKTIPGWLPVLIIIAAIALIVAIIILIIKIKAPRINGLLKISVMLPPELASMTPPEYEIDLSTIGRKGKVTLEAIFAANLTSGGQYSQALASISGFISKLAFESPNSAGSQLKIHLPKIDNSASVQFCGVPVTKAGVKSLSIGMPVNLVYSTMGSEYQFTFTLASGDWSGGDPFGGGSGSFGGGNDNGGFGGFGGGNDNGGFGGFGGGNDIGGFGGFGGGNDNGGFGGFGGGNDNGGFGSFGGGNDNGGFGGFGGGNDNSGFGGFGGGNNNSGFGNNGSSGGGFGSF